MHDQELRAMSAISEALSPIEDKSVVQRILRWTNERFGYVPVQQMQSNVRTVTAMEAGSESNEIPGIAKLSENGELRVTIRDLKAKSANDAAIRLALIGIRVYCALTKTSSVSSKEVIVPLLRRWRVYDSNTRTVLARHKGIVRSGDILELDEHATREADQYIRDVLDESAEGSWKPGSKTRAKARPAQSGRSGDSEGK